MFFAGGKTHDFCFGVNAVIARWSHSGGTLENTAGMRSQQAIFHQRFFGERKAEWLKLFLFHLKLPGCITEIEKSQQRFSIPPGYRPPDGRYRRSKTVQRRTAYSSRFSSSQRQRAARSGINVSKRSLRSSIPPSNFKAQLQSITSFSVIRLLSLRAIWVSGSLSHKRWCI